MISKNKIKRFVALCCCGLALSVVLLLFYQGTLHACGKLYPCYKPYSRTPAPRNEDLTVDRASEIKDRIAHVNKTCEKINRPIKSSRTPAIYYLPKYNVSYCNVGKTGSTHLKRLFLMLVGLDNEKQGPKILTHKTAQRLLVSYGSQKWKHSRVILPTRNPYTRLYSSYIDNVFLPSPVQKPYKSSSICPSFVTFEYFLRAVFQEFKRNKLNTHWSPVLEVCKPCELQATYIIKQESYDQDIAYLIQQLKLPRNESNKVDKMVRSQANLEIIGFVKNVILDIDKAKCGRWFDNMALLWKAFQIQGYIHKKAELAGFYNGTRDAKIKDYMLESVFTARERYPLTLEERTLQRRWFLVNAYRNVSESVLRDFKNIFSPDFELFGYDSNPPAP